MGNPFLFETDVFKGEEQELLLNETLFHNANGYFGVRSNFEEKYPADRATVRGQYVNGFYNISEMKQAEKHYGFKEQKQTMVNTFDTQTMILELDGERVDLFAGKVLSFHRILDMKRGITKRVFRWESPSGRQVEVSITRMASFDLLPLFTIEYTVTPLNFSGEAVLISGHSGDVSNYFNPKDSRVAGEKVVHMKALEMEEVAGGITLIHSATTKSGLHIASAVKHTVSEACGEEIRKAGNGFEKILSFQVTEGVPVTVVKTTVTCDSLRYGNVREDVLFFMDTALKKPLELWYQKQEEYLQDFWERADISIDGDEELNLSLHYNLYQLLQSVGKDAYSNIAAKGLSGEGYEGHYFWDTEMYMLPFFTLTQPKLARNLLEYRYQILDKARENARLMGHKSGALYPWRTINGEECSGYFPSGGAQYHINGDISYAVVQYYLAAGDWEFMASKGAEILMETARMWADLGHFHKGQFQIHCVTGPDEYTCVVNNNYYTNLTAKHNLSWAAKVYRMMKDRGELGALEGKIGIREAEIEAFEKAAAAMYLPYDRELDINPQDDSFLTKKVWDLAATPEEEFPIMQHHHLLELYRYQVCKQADTVLAHFIFEDEQKMSTMRNSFAYYEKVTTHDSSLSRCIFGIMASKLGEREKAYQYFDFSSKLDICNSQKNTKDGIHTANMGGTYMAVVYGFLGLRVKEEGFFLAPTIPRQWKSYRVRISLRGSLLEVTVTPGCCVLRLVDGAAVTVSVNGVRQEVRDEVTLHLTA